MSESILGVRTKLFFIRMATKKHEHVNIVEAETVRDALEIVQEDLAHWGESLEEAITEIVPLDLSNRPIRYGYTSPRKTQQERETDE